MKLGNAMICRKSKYQTILNNKGEQPMINSMTGFGRGQITTVDMNMTIEMKSVNHRYCDISIRLPRRLFFLENKIKNQIKERVGRGKVDVFISFRDESAAGTSLFFNKNLAKQYLDRFEAMASDYDLTNDVTVYELARFPEIFSLEEGQIDESELEKLTADCLEIALEKLCATRYNEGQMLKNDLLGKLEDLGKITTELKTIVPTVVEEYRQKLLKRMSELTDVSILPEERVSQEVLFFADKSCIDEEMVRLESHILQMQNLMTDRSKQQSNQAIGRKLDFIAQEMNREANTILSKANNINISNQGIEMKSIIEMIREQIQNIE